MEFPKPSAYTPFFRRFANERERELEEARQLYARVKRQQDAFTEDATSIGRRAVPYFAEVSDDLFTELAWLMRQLTSAEPFMRPLPPPAFDRMNLREFVEYQNLLHQKEYFFRNQGAILDLFEEGLVRVIGGISRELPATSDPSPFTIPLVYALPQPGLTVDRIYGSLADEPYTERGLFIRVAEILYRNLCEVSGNEPGQQPSRPWKTGAQSKLPLDQLAPTYLAGSPFEEFFEVKVPLKLTHEERFNHMHIVGGTGAGKTTLLEQLILHDLASDDPPSMVLIDPHGDMINRLIHADLGIEDRLVYINPRDTKHAPALNVFAVNQDRLGKYDEATREQVTAGVIQTFDYLFSGLFSAELTGKQSVFFRYVARLMLSLPETMGRNATILDMMRLMADPVPYGEAIGRLPEIPREFFMRDFMSKTFAQTKEQIRYRLQAIIENPTLARLFTSPYTKVDIFAELNRGSIILVDTAKDFLKDGSSTFGRIFISLTLQAVLERAAIPERERKHTFLIVDEAASYFDSNIDDLLTEARKYRCGCVFSHQYLDQASSSLRASLAANTGAKFASGLSAADARSMAPEMRTTADFILNQPRHQFAAHIRNVTPQAVSIPIRRMDDLPSLSDDAFARLIERNRERVSIPTLQPRASQEQPSARENADDRPRRGSRQEPDTGEWSEW